MKTLRVATYNIHKGVQGLGPQRRLEIHNLGLAVEQLDADIVCLQEVRKMNRREAQYFTRWPELSQADYLAPEGYEAVYRTNAFTKHGEHGNALLSRFPIANMINHDVSDHAFEQRGILHCELNTKAGTVHCYVVHLGLFESGRGRQTAALIEAVNKSAGNGEPVIIAGDFNDWRNTLSDKLRQELGVVEVFDQLDTAGKLSGLMRSLVGKEAPPRPARTFPAALPWFRLDRIYVRGFKVTSAEVLHGTLWAKLSDHAPILANLSL